MIQKCPVQGSWVLKLDNTFRSRLSGVELLPYTCLSVYHAVVRPSRPDKVLPGTRCVCFLGSLQCHLDSTHNRPGWHREWVFSVKGVETLPQQVVYPVLPLQTL